MTDRGVRFARSKTEMGEKIMEFPNEPQSINRDADALKGFVLDMHDGSQIDASSDIDENGVTIGLGFLETDLGHSAWGEVRVSWTAIAAVAEELNAMIRAAGIKGWIDPPTASRI